MPIGPTDPDRSILPKSLPKLSFGQDHLLFITVLRETIGKVLGSNPHRHYFASPRRYEFVDSSFAWFLSGQTCPRMGGFCSRSGRGVPDNLLLLRLHSPLLN